MESPVHVDGLKVDLHRVVLQVELVVLDLHGVEFVVDEREDIVWGHEHVWSSVVCVWLLRVKI